MSECSESPLEVLLVEDNPGDVRLIESHLDRMDSALLTRTVELHVANRLSSALESIESTTIDLILLDLGLPDSSGLDTLDSITDHAEGLPVAVLTVLDDKTTAVEAIQAGAQDYLYKGKIDEETLARTMRYAIERHQREQVLHQRSKRLKLLTRILHHDVRTDISIIRGNTQLVLEENDLGETECERLTAVAEASTHVEGLVETAREYVDSVFGGGEVALRPVSLETVLSNAVRKAETTFDEAVFRRPSEIPDREVLADEMLSSVFRNLLHNAVQHNDKATPEVEILVDAGDERVEVRVGDNGPGVPDGLKQAVFQEGRQPIESDGTGLGLHLVDRLVDRYGGEIYVEDNDPEGAVFAIELRTAD